MNTTDFNSFLKQIASQDIFVIDASITKSEYTTMDLSETNPELLTFNISSSKDWETYIANYLKKKKKKVAFGGYLEKRGIYNRSDYFNTESLENERNIHLGLDLWVDAGTSVLTAFNGEIHSFRDNTNFGDYGPTIILKHEIDGFLFYTLYGHLSRKSLTNLKVGAKVKQGEIIAYLGKAEVNGDYAPHLHFQIIIDLQGNIGDYPGVCSEKDIVMFSNNCPNPNIILNLK